MVFFLKKKQLLYETQNMWDLIGAVKHKILHLFFFFLNSVISFCIVMNFLIRWFHIISYPYVATMQRFKFVFFFNSLYKLYLKFNVNISFYLCIYWSGGLALVLRLFLSCFHVSLYYNRLKETIQLMTITFGIHNLRNYLLT